ncbi:MAG: helix-turn-helix domain-containing protein, partial [Candidatus Binataceae bacterium]
AIEALAAHFIEHYNRLFGKQLRFLSRRALNALKAYDWPGNVREFAHAVQSAVMLSDDDRIERQALPESVRSGASGMLSTDLHEHRDGAGEEADVLAAGSSSEGETVARRLSDSQAGPLLLDEVIKRTLLRSLDETDGNRRRAADLLGISRSTLYRMLARYRIEEEGGRHRSGSREPMPGAGSPQI